MAKTSWSKADEAAMLRSFVEKAQEQPDSYLASLLSPELLDWFGRQIKQDLDTNALAYEAGYREHVGKLRSAEARAERAETMLIEIAQEIKDKIAASVKARTIEVEQMLANESAAKERALAVAKTEIERSALLATGLDRYVGLADERFYKLSEAEHEIVRLKARLFDLIEQVERLTPKSTD